MGLSLLFKFVINKKRVFALFRYYFLNLVLIKFILLESKSLSILS